MFKFNKTPFAHVFFHDIKNKLGSVKFSISMLKNPKIGEQQREKLVNSLILTIEKTIDMLQDFIETERFKKTKFLKNENIILKELIKEIINDLETDIERKKISIYLNVEEAEKIKTNKEWLKKALYNIIHNSIKYNKENGELFISVTAEKQGYLLTIRDTGIGMSEEEKKQIFKKYYTSGKDHGTGIGLNMSKAVIESIGGAIAVDSEKDKGSKFFIYLPKTSKQIKLKKLAAALSGIIVFLFLSIDYYVCLIPQKIEIEKSDTSVIYKLENNVIAITDKNDDIKIEAFRNLFDTKNRTKFILKKADIKINTNFNPIEVVANGQIIKNHGTEFETVTDNKIFATSVYKGSIKADKTDVYQNQGIVLRKNKLVKSLLPSKVTNINIAENSKKDITLSWDSPYKNFTILLSKNKNFNETPLYKLTTASKNITLDNIKDGIWYVSVQAQKNSLFSLPVVKKFLSLRYYYKALNAYENQDLSLAETLADISISSVKEQSYKPYLLKSLISAKKNDYKTALQFAKKAYNIQNNKKTTYNLAYIYYKNSLFGKSIKLLRKINDKNIYELLAYDYYKLGDYANAKKYLYKTLETNPNNKQALKYMIEILKKENNKFLLEYFKKQLKDNE